MTLAFEHDEFDQRPRASFLVSPQEICGVFFQWNNFVAITVN